MIGGGFAGCGEGFGEQGEEGCRDEELRGDVGFEGGGPGGGVGF